MRLALRYITVAAFFLLISTIAAADQITISFDQQGDLVDKVLVENQYQSAGATFTGFAWDDGGLLLGNPTGFSGGALVNWVFGGYALVPTMTISFESIVNSAVFAAVDQGNEFTFVAYLDTTEGTTPVDSVTSPVFSSPGASIGFSNENFNRITITRTNPNDLSAFAIDSLQFVTGSIEPPPPPVDPPPAQVPEPASLLLIGSGITSIAAVLRKRRAT